MKNPITKKFSNYPKLKTSTSIQDNLKNIIPTAIIIWLIPFVLSVPLFILLKIDSKVDFLTTNLNYIVFKIIMLLILGLLSWAGFEKLNRGNFFYRNQNALLSGFIIFGIQAVLDLFILVGFLGQKFDFWSLTILPVYLIIPLIFWFRNSRQGLVL